MNEADHILLVDDDPAIRRLLKRMLSALPVTWLEADNVSDGMTFFLEHAGSIRAVWTDVQLPDGSGYDLAESIRAIAPDLPVVFLSGAKIDPSGHGLLQREHTFCLQKPFTKPTVVELAEEVLRFPVKA